MNTWFTADLHLGHTNIIKYCNRPFSSVEEMDNKIISNWNERITDGDDVYILGDFAFGNVGRYLDRLKGDKHLIVGSHDKQTNNSEWTSVSDMKKIVIEGQQIVLCHYAMRTWAASHYNSWQLYGHSHSRLPGIGKQIDVGVDCHGFAPISFNKVKKLMELQPDNFNLVRRAE